MLKRKKQTFITKFIQTDANRDGGFCIWAKLLQSTHPICLLVIKLPTSHQQFKPLSEKQRLTRNCYAEMLLISLSSEISLMMSCGHLGTKVSFPARNERHRKMGKCYYREGRIYKARIYQEWFHTRCRAQTLIKRTRVSGAQESVLLSKHQCK